VTVSIENIPANSTQLRRVLLVDDHDLLRQGLRSMLEARGGWTICGEASTGLQAIELSKQLRPDIAIVDIHMPGMDGLQATRQILASNPQIEVLILTLDESEAVVRAATAAGARGIVLKSDAANELVAAMVALGGQEAFYTSKASSILVQRMAHSLGDSTADRGGLTKRERDVVILVAEGQSNKGIGDTLNISAKTVESHRRNAMHKLGLKSTAELVRYAVRDGLIQP
jgi:DNA-binding NarL/FixJ family response regulator